MRMRLFAVSMATVLAAMFCQSLLAVTITNPTGLASNLNTLNRTIIVSNGNYTVAQFNQYPTERRYTFTFDSANGYTAATAIDRISLPTFRVDLARQPNTGGGSYMQTDTAANRFSSGDQSLALGGNVTNVTVSFTSGVYGVFFMLARNVNMVTVQVWSASSQIGGNYTIAGNSGTNFSHFGYFNWALNEVYSVRLSGTMGNNGWWIDDLGVITQPPLPGTLVLVH